MKVRSQSRQQKVRDVLSKKQTDFTVVLENVHDPHNVMAIIRSCDAIGIYEIHLIESIKATWDNSIGKRSSAGSKKWIKVNRHKTVDSCYQQLRNEGKAIFTTHMAQNSADLYDLDLCKPTALVYGNEHQGVSEEAVAKADGNFQIPQMGMIQSLNVSVACAVSLFEGLRQRKAAGLYNEPHFSPEALEALFDVWIKK